MWHRNLLLHISLLFAAGLLLAPKIILIEFFSYRWVESSVLDIALYLLQVVLLLVAFFVIAATTISRIGWSG